jgi:hypothetical protein
MNTGLRGYARSCSDLLLFRSLIWSPVIVLVFAFIGIRDCRHVIDVGSVARRSNSAVIRAGNISRPSRMTVGELPHGRNGSSWLRCGAVTASGGGRRLIHVRSVEHRRFSVRPSRHEHEPGPRDCIRNREVFARAEQDELWRLRCTPKEPPHRLHERRRGSAPGFSVCSPVQSPRPSPPRARVAEVR